jgi:hypothetical protein
MKSYLSERAGCLYRQAAGSWNVLDTLGDVIICNHLSAIRRFRHVLEPSMGFQNLSVTTQARQEIRIWRGLTQRHMGVRGRTGTWDLLTPIGLVQKDCRKLPIYMSPGWPRVDLDLAGTRSPSRLLRYTIWVGEQAALIDRLLAPGMF